MFANIKEKAKDNIKPLLKSVSIGASAVGVCLQILEFLHFKIPSYLPIILFGFTAKFKRCIRIENRNEKNYRSRRNHKSDFR